MLNKNYFIQDLQVITCCFITSSGCSYRIGTLLNLAFNLFAVDLILSWHYSMVELQTEAVLAKVAAKLTVQRLCLAWCSNSLTMCSGTLPTGVSEGLGKIQILAKSEFSSRILSSKQGCPTLYHFEVEDWGLMYLPSVKLASCSKSCSNFF